MIEKIALQKNLITRDQCAEALAACRGADNLEVALKDYFLSRKMISVGQMKHLISTYHALKIMKKNDLFGRIAVKFGHIKSARFKEEMVRQKQAMARQSQPRFIGELWMETRVLTREQFKNILQTTKKLQTTAARPSSPPLAKSPDASPQTPVRQADHSLKAELPGGILLEVDSRGMTAMIRKTDQFEEDITAREIQNRLGDLDILYGVAPEKNIQGFIRSKGFREKPFKAAAGTPPRPGKDARVEYYFDTDHLKASGVDAEGKIDFKDRGEIPWVEEGTLLAEKFPMSEARNGRTIFDQEVEMPPAADLPLKFKSGVVPSEDGFRLYAEIDGHPRLDMTGAIQVTDTFTVKEDVSYETGHLNYHGDIDVKGTLKAGFKVMGQSVRINTVDGGEIHARGDVTVVNSINDARIYARGNVTAKFIQNSEIFCMGNLTVTKEILDCTIETSGAVLIANGEVISSNIICNMGLFTRHLGTDKSVPNTVTAGVDAFTDREIAAIDQGIAQCRERLEQIRTKTDTLSREVRELHGTTGRISYQMDKAREEAAALPEEERGKGSRSLNSKALIARLEKDLNQIFERIEKKEKKMLDLAGEREQVEDNLEDFFYEQANFSDWQAANPGTPVVCVTGRVSPGTVVSGPGGATREVTEHLTNVKIKEVLSKDPMDEGKPEIQIHDNIRK
ncbi:MAG: DUF342 domain-containing protein [Desulfobacter sp.]|nr:MAG: DUF342 domain-containing protein [Desulfobacter sp.]